MSPAATGISAGVGDVRRSLAGEGRRLCHGVVAIVRLPRVRQGEWECPRYNDEGCIVYLAAAAAHSGGSVVEHHMQFCQESLQEVAFECALLEDRNALSSFDYYDENNKEGESALTRLIKRLSGRRQ
jgi:hypothetical protein